MYVQEVSHHKQLDVWARAMDLAVDSYRVSGLLPAEERFGLIAQIRRAAVSIPSNLAEGASHGSAGDFLRFVAIAKGSLGELETQFLLAHRLGMLSAGDIPTQRVTAVRRMLIRLSQSLRRKRTI